MKLLQVILFFAVFGGSGICRGGDDPAPVAILGAFGEEVQLLNTRLENRREITFLGISFTEGKLQGKPVVLAKSGMGKVNAAMTTALVLERFQPRAVIFTGIAGGVSPASHPGDMIIGEKLLHHDHGVFGQDGLKTGPTTDPVSEKNNPLIFPADRQLVGLAVQAAGQTPFAQVHGRQPSVTSGVIATGDSFIASAAKCAELSKNFQALAVEMEGAAVAQICYQQKCPFVVIRSISDNADSKAEQDVRKFYKTAANNSAELVIAMMGLYR